MPLQTKTYSLGSFDRLSGSSNGYILDLILTEESVDSAANTSLVSWKLQLRSGPSNRFDWELTASLRLNGTQVASVTDDHYLDYNSSWVMLQGSAQVPHLTDGTLDMAFSATITAWDGGTVYTPPDMTLEGAMPLTAIPRASTLAAAPAFIGDATTIAVARKSAGYTHSIFYEFGSLSGYLADSAGATGNSPVMLSETTLLFPIPEEFYGQIPDAPSGQCCLTCTTYDGQRLVGSATTEFTVTADPARCAPTLTGTAADVNEATLALTGDDRVLVAGQSEVLCTLQAQALWGATLVALYVNGVQTDGTEHTISPADTATIVLRAVDSRGYATDYAVPGLTLVDYVPPSLHVYAERTDPTSGRARLTGAGKWFDGSFGAVTNALNAACRVGEGDWQNLTPVTEGGAFSLETVLEGLDYRTGHTLQLRLSDCLQTVIKTAAISRGIPVFDWGGEDFVFHVPVTFTATDGTAFRLDLVNGQLTAIKEE